MGFGRYAKSNQPRRDDAVRDWAVGLMQFFFGLLILFLILLASTPGCASLRTFAESSGFVSVTGTVQRNLGLDEQMATPNVVKGPMEKLPIRKGTSEQSRLAAGEQMGDYDTRWAAIRRDDGQVINAAVWAKDWPLPIGARVTIYPDGRIDGL